MNESLYMLDTNTVSYLIKGQYPKLKKRLQSVPMNRVCISSITEAELRLGVVKKPGATKLPLAVEEMFIRVTTLPWDSDSAVAYAHLRYTSERKGLNLGSMDMLIAAHSIAVDAVLVTNDRGFYHLDQWLKLEDWTK